MERQPLTTAPEPMDLNTASAEQLRTLPGIGRTLAARLVKSREEDGRFAHVGDLLRVPGITAKVFERIVALVAVNGPISGSRPSLPASSRHMVPTSGELVAEEEHTPVGELGPALAAVPQLRVVRRPPPLPSEAIQDGSEADPPEAAVAEALISVPLLAAPDEATEPSAKDTSEEAAPPEPEPEPVVAVAAEPEPVVAVAQSPGPAPSVRRPPAGPRARRFGVAALAVAGLVALALAAGTTGAVYGGRLQGYATQSDMKAESEKIWTEIDTVKGDQRKVSATVDLMAEVAAQFPATLQRVDALRAGTEAQQRDAAEALAATQRLTREVTAVRDTMRKSQKDADRRMFELRLEIESGPQDRSLHPAREGHPADAVSKKRP